MSEGKESGVRCCSLINEASPNLKVCAIKVKTEVLYSLNFAALCYETNSLTNRKLWKLYKLLCSHLEKGLGFC